MIVNIADKPVRDLLCICAFNLFCWVLLALEAGLGFGCATAIVVGFDLLMELEVRDMTGIKGYKRRVVYACKVRARQSSVVCVGVQRGGCDLMKVGQATSGREFYSARLRKSASRG